MTAIGKFISFEGTDGSGKSTQLRLASEFLTSKGIRHVVTREPGGSVLAEKLRALLISDKMSPDVELMLMMTARKDHVVEVIAPALARGEWVISDRFFDSSFAYQGGGRGLAVSRIKEILKWAIGDFAPDLTFMLELSVEEAERRMNERLADGTRASKDKFEVEKERFFHDVRLMMEDLAGWPENASRIRMIDAAQTIEEVERDIQSHLKALISVHQREMRSVASNVLKPMLENPGVSCRETD